MSSPHRALVVIDVQQDYFSGPLEVHHPPHAESLPQVLRAIDAATAAGLPVAVFQHDSGQGSPVFDPTQPGFELHPEVRSRRTEAWRSSIKRFGSVFASTDLLPWLREQDVDTITLVGYMTNNCVLASSVEAEGLGLAVEVLRDATGAVNLANEAGTADAETVHRTLMTLLHSNWAAVTDTATWVAALEAGQQLRPSDLGSSAVLGARTSGPAA